VTQGAGPRRIGTARRRQIVAFVRRYQAQHGRGPRTSEIGRGVGYRAHNLRARHLDKMAGLVQVEGRWEVRE